MRYLIGCLSVFLFLFPQVSLAQTGLFQLPDDPASNAEIAAPDLPEARELFQSESIHPPDPGKSGVILGSLLLPGTGERMMGADGRGTLFTSMEAGLWLGYIGLTLYSHWRKQDYKAYAVQYAGVSGGDKDEKYWIDVGTYDNLDAFNDQRLRERTIEEVYPDEPAYRWDWVSRDHQVKFDRMRIQSRKAAKFASFTIGAVILNHIASALDATYLYNSQVSMQGDAVSYRIEIPLN